MTTQRLSGRVAANVGLTILALVFAGLVPFGFNLLVGRAYGPATLGGISVVLGLALFLGQVPSTVGVAATKFMAEALGRGDEPAARAVFRFLFTLNLGLTGLLAVAMIVTASWIRQALHVPLYAVLLASALLLVYSLYLFLKSVYYGIQRVSSYVWNEIVSDIAFFVLLAAVFAFHATPWLLLPFVLNNAIFAVIAVYHLRPYFHDFAWVSPASQSETLRYSIVNGLGSAASLGRTLLGTTVAGLFLTHHAVGLYAAAVALTSPLQLMPRALALVLFATMARLHGAGRASSVRELLDLSTEWLVVVLGILCGLLIINATAILTALFRSEYVHAATATQLVVFGSYLLMISSPAISALSSTTHVRIPTVAAILGLGTSLALWLLLIPRLGIDGAALGFAAGSVITGGIPVYWAYRLVGTNRVRFLRLGVILGVLTLVLLVMGRVPLAASAVFVGAVALLYIRQVPSCVALVRSVVTSRRAARGSPTTTGTVPGPRYPPPGQPRGQGAWEDASSGVVSFTLDAVRMLHLEISEVQDRDEASVADGIWSNAIVCTAPGVVGAKALRLRLVPSGPVLAPVGDICTLTMHVVARAGSTTPTVEIALSSAQSGGEVSPALHRRLPRMSLLVSLGALLVLAATVGGGRLAAALAQPRHAPPTIRRAPAAGARSTRVDGRWGVAGRSRSLKGEKPPAITAGSAAAVSASTTILVNPIALQFEARSRHATTAVHTIHIANLGPGVLTIASITINGSAAADFTTRDTCIDVAIAVDDGCVIRVRFKPEIHGIDRANLVVTDNGMQSPHTVPLQGRS